MDAERARTLLESERAEVEAMLREITGSGEQDREAEQDVGDSSDTADALESEGVDNAVESSLRARLQAIERAGSTDLAVRWQNRTPVNLGTVGGITHNRANAVNAAGERAGAEGS